MPDTPPIRAFIDLSPTETVRAFAARDDLRATVRWSEMWHADHARAFTVAKVAKLDLLAEIQSSLANMLANGGTFEQWQAGLVPHLQAQGWWGKVADRALTGTDDEISVGPRRLRTIYDTNLRVSRAAGRWARIQELKGARPFLRYTAVLDARTRPEHRRWHGVILPVDHEWWDTHFPPCGWFCRCTVRQLSQRELDAKGWQMSPVPDDGPPREFFPAGRTTPELVPAGISPGWAYNPGRATMASTAAKATRAIEAAAATDLAAARATLDELVASPAFPAALSEPGVAFPAMVLDDATRSALDVAPRVAELTAEIARFGLDGELTLADLRALPEIGTAPDHVVADGDTRWLIRRHGDRLLGARLVTDDLGRLLISALSWLDDAVLAKLLGGSGASQ